MPSVRYDVSTAGLIDCSYCRKAAFAEPSGETGTASQCLASTAPTESYAFVKAVVTTVLAFIHRLTIAMLPTIRFRSTRIHAHDVAINATACPADAKEIEPKAKYIPGQSHLISRRTRAGFVPRYRWRGRPGNVFLGDYLSSKCPTTRWTLPSVVTWPTSEGRAACEFGWRPL